MEHTLERMGVYSLVINSGLVVLKLGLAAREGSLALAASATDSVVDIIGSLYPSSCRRASGPTARTLVAP
jgi:divalent metal cation (Fe/Co/Zn/Cd) transporter